MDSSNITTLLTTTECVRSLSCYVSSNASDNHTSPPLPHAENVHLLYQSFLQVVCIFILTVGVVGNGLVLIVFGHRFSSIKAFEVYMLSLAAADFIGTVILPSLQLHAVYSGDFTHFGNAGCKTVYFMSIASITVSAWTLVVVSIDRYFIVKWPLRERRPTFLLITLTSIPWFLGFGHGFIYLIDDYIKLDRQGDVMVCRLHFQYVEMLIFATATLLVQNVLPLILMCIVYSCIIVELRNSAMMVFEQGYRERQARKKRNKRALRLLVVIVSVFFACTTPYNVLYVWYLSNHTEVSHEQIYPVYTLLTMLLMCNSCLNPLIYAKLHHSFRRYTFELLCVRKVARRVSKRITLVASRSWQWTLERRSKYMCNVYGEENKNTQSPEEQRCVVNNDNLLEGVGNTSRIRETLF